MWLFSALCIVFMKQLLNPVSSCNSGAVKDPSLSLNLYNLHISLLSYLTVSEFLRPSLVFPLSVSLFETPVLQCLYTLDVL